MSLNRSGRKKKEFNAEIAEDAEKRWFAGVGKGLVDSQGGIDWKDWEARRIAWPPEGGRYRGLWPI